MRLKRSSRNQHCKLLESSKALRPSRLNYTSSRSRPKHAQVDLREPQDSEIYWVQPQSYFSRCWAPLYPRDWVQLSYYHQLRWVLQDLQGASSSVRLNYNQNFPWCCAAWSWRPSRQGICETDKQQQRQSRRTNNHRSRGGCRIAVCSQLLEPLQ